MQERERFTRQHHQSVILNASRIREERKNGAISTQIYKEKNQGEYLKIKKQQSIN